MHTMKLVAATFIAFSGLGAVDAFARGGAKLGAADGMDVTVALDPASLHYVASGAIGTARSEPLTGFAPSPKWIGCWIDCVAASGTGAGSCLMTCEALTDTLVDLRCMSADPALIGALGSINSDSRIKFMSSNQPGSSPGTCLSLTVDNSSRYLPKAP